MHFTEKWRERSQPHHAQTSLLAVAFRATILCVLGLGPSLFCVTLAHSQQPPPPTPPSAPGNPDLPPIPAPPINRQAVQPAFSVVIDPAHGGANSGAKISATELEKDITLALSARLRSALSARGIAVTVTRDTDLDLPTNNRAGIANHALASACLVLHATATGSGVHLFTSSLTPSPSTSSSPNSPTLTSWHVAQAPWATRSLRLASEINSALGQTGIPATLGVASIRPIDNLACPAVAVEIAPLAASAANKALPLSDAKYQQRILDALAASILEWSTNWKQQP